MQRFYLTERREEIEMFGMKRIFLFLLVLLLGLMTCFGFMQTSATNTQRVSAAASTLQPYEVTQTAWALYYPSATNTPVPMPLADGLPLQPRDGEDLVAFVDNFLNASPDNAARLPKLLYTLKTYNARTYGQAYHFVNEFVRVENLDNDEVEERVAVIPQFDVIKGQSQIAVVVFDPSPRSGFTHTVYSITLSSAFPAQFKLLQIDDINNDGIKEIVLGGEYIPRFDVCIVIILQWRDGKLHELLHAEITNGIASFPLNPRSNLQEVWFSGGQIGIAGFGWQRDHTEKYAWDGTACRFTESIPDPVVSQDAFWRLADGSHAFRKGDYTKALRLYQSALQAPAIASFYFGSDRTSTIAAARFQIMLTYIMMRQEAKAMQIYRNAQFKDGAYAKWSKAFMDVYQTKRDLGQACQAARDLISLSDIPFGTDTFGPGQYGGNLSGNVGGTLALCPTVAN